jgi:hypothetical protein
MTIANSIFILCLLLSTVRIVTDAPNPTRLHTDIIAKRSDQRFAALKAALPSRGVVGYVGATGDAAAGDYYLAQYALVPLVVDYSPNHPLVIGNFPVAPPPPGPPSEHLQLVKDFGDGVLLFANRDAK